MNPHLQRGWMLFQQGRLEQAEEELRLALAQEPEQALPHALLSICLSQKKQFSEANEEIEHAIHLAPDNPFIYYAQANVLLARNQRKEAKQAIETAIGFDPFQVQHFATLAQIEISLENWKAALAAAEKGLELDSEDVDCTNFRAVALVKLGKAADAENTLGSALQRAPEDAFSHANMGWSLLEKNQPDKAMEHFREALRLDPGMEWARAGIIEAMKARFFLYRIMLNWFLWMAKLQQNARFGVIIGAYVGYRLLGNVAANNPDWAPYLQPILILYITFAIMTWVSSPLFNLVLRTSRFGRLALSPEEIRTSNWVGGCVLGAVATLVAYFATGENFYLAAALAWGLSIPPLAALYACSEGWPRAIISTIAIALVGTAAYITSCVTSGYWIGGEVGQAFSAAGIIVFLPFVYLAIAAQFATMFLVSARPKKGTNAGRVAWIGGFTVLCLLAFVLAALLTLLLVSASSESPTDRTGQDELVESPPSLLVIKEVPFNEHLFQNRALGRGGRVPTVSAEVPSTPKHFGSVWELRAELT